MDRKNFIKTFGFTCLSAIATTSLLQSCISTNYFAKYTLSNNQISVSKSEFINIDKKKSTRRKHVLIKTDKFNFPICIYKTAEENYSALLMECTHKSCELQPHGDYLICPCHGSEFSNKGIVQNSPAEQNLQTFKINTDDENIYIQL